MSGEDRRRLLLAKMIKRRIDKAENTLVRVLVKSIELDPSANYLTDSVLRIQSRVISKLSKKELSK